MRITLLSFFLLSATFLSAQDQAKSDSTKIKEIEEVTIKSTKKAIEQKADRTIFDFSEQSHLNSGTAMEGIKKLPGLIVSDVAGMMYQGKILDVYMDNRPLNITSNELNAFLEGMPANSIDRIEVITQPGAEFPATSGGAILNIITSKNAKKYLTATYAGNYSFTNYDKHRSRTNNSINLNARNNLFGWQLNFGENYRETMNNGSVEDFSVTKNDRIGRGYFAKGALTFDFGKDRLILNYDAYLNNNDNWLQSAGLDAQNSQYEFGYKTGSKNVRQVAGANYQKRFDDRNKKLDFRYTYSQNKSDFSQKWLQFNELILDNKSSFSNSNFKIDYSQPIKILDEGKVSFGGLYEISNFDTKSRGITNLDYERQTLASYLELQASLKKLDFILGTRAENYDVSGITRTYDDDMVLQEKDLIPFNKFKLFPNATVKYNFFDQAYFSLNYNKKINLPSISALNPNNTTLQNPNSVVTGNPFLQPTIYDNFEAKISAFDYVFVGYNLSVAKNQVAQILTRNGNVVFNRQENIEELRIHNFNMGIPVPFMIFNTPVKEMLKFNFNPDKINFMYLYAGYQKHQIPNRNNKGFWMFNVMTQFILPKDIKMVANYNTITPKSNYYYFQLDKAYNQSFDVNFSKKFFDDRLNVSVFANDLFNQNKTVLSSVAELPPLQVQNKVDSRNFGISLTYKIRNKNKLAKEDPNLLNQDKKNEEGGVLQGQ